MSPAASPHRRRVRIQQRSSTNLAVPLHRWLLVAILLVFAAAGVRFVVDEYQASLRDRRRSPNHPTALAAVSTPAAVPTNVPAPGSSVTSDTALLPVNSGHAIAFAPVTDSFLARWTANGPAPAASNPSAPYAAPPRNVPPTSASAARIAAPEHFDDAPRGLTAFAPTVPSGLVANPASPIVAPVGSAPTPADPRHAPSKGLRGSGGPVTSIAPVPVTFTWSGGAAGTDATWSNGGNWIGGIAPVASLAESNDITFTSTPTTATTSTVNGAYGVGNLTFDAGTPSYTLGDGGGASLGLNDAGGVTDNSTNAQTINPVTTISLGVTINVAQGGQLNLNGATATFMSPGSVLTVTGAGNTTISGNITPGSPANLGDGSIVKSGAGTLTLSGNNSYTGGTTLNAGTLDVQSNTALGTGTLTVNGGSIANNNTGSFLADTVFVANNIVLNSSLDYGNSNGYIEFDGNLNLGAATRTITSSNASGAANIGFNFDITFNGVISASNTDAGLTFSNSAHGSFALGGTGANTYTGLTTVDGVYLLLQKSNGAVAIAGDLTVLNYGDVSTSGGQLATTTNLKVNSNATFDATGGFSTPANETVASLNGDDTGTVTIGNQFTRSTLTVGTGTMNGLIQDGIVDESDITAARGATPSDTPAPLTGGALVKTSSGTLTLTHNNTYSGGTTVNAGTLLANNTPILSTDSATGTGAVQVNAGGTLGGYGTVGGTNGMVTIGDGGSTPAHLAPGSNGVGILTILNALSLASNAEVDTELGGAKGGTGYDQAFIGGALTLNGTLNVKLVNGFVPFAGEKFYILDVTTTDGVSGAFTNVTNGLYTDAAGDLFAVKYNDSDPGDPNATPDNDVSLTLLAVPEPGSLALAGLGAAVGLGLLRRRQKRRAA